MRRRDGEEGGGGHRLDGELAAAQRLGIGPVPGLAELLHGRGEPGSEVLEDPHRCVSYRQTSARPLWTFVRWTDVSRVRGRMSVATMVWHARQSRCMRIRLHRTFFAAVVATAALAAGAPDRQRRPARGVRARLHAEADEQAVRALGRPARTTTWRRAAPSRRAPARGRSTGGASIVSGNEPWKVDRREPTRARSSSRRARPPPRPVICVGLEHPTLRLFAQQQPRAALDPRPSRSSSRPRSG